MRIINIRNLGPIKEASVRVMPLTVFCGKQGSGKSTLAKIITSCLWMEKALAKGVVSKKYLEQYNHFRKNICGYLQFADFFSDSTYIKFQGGSYTFIYESGHFFVDETSTRGFQMPKISYVPAERNLLVAIDRAEKIKGLPPSLADLQDSYTLALRHLNGKEELGIDDFMIEYDKSHKATWIMGDGYRIKVHEAASGLQSSVPLLLVTQYLAQASRNNKEITLTSEERMRISMEIKKIQENKKLSEDTKNIMIENIDNRFRISCFWNIVEEPEQNLYPTSQRAILYTLIKVLNGNSDNGLILTTHSPFIINYLTLSIKAKSVENHLTEKVEDRKKEMEEIVPEQSRIDGSKVAIYQISDIGIVTRLPDYQGLPSDENYLNAFLAETNDDFDKLIEIEDGMC